jgi:hypothetical protein
MSGLTPNATAPPCRAAPRYLDRHCDDEARRSGNGVCVGLG